MIIRFDYNPAVRFARYARNWYSETVVLATPSHTGEPPLLVLLYSVMSLEAFLDEQLDARLGAAGKNTFLQKHKCASLMARWSSALKQLATSDQDAQDALRTLGNACKDDGTFGLLVRARNKLVHPGRVTEVSDASGDKIENDSIDRLIQQVKAPPVSIPYISAQFPGMLTCRASAEWSLQTLRLMVTGFYTVVSEPLPAEWAEALGTPV